jgi:hypothetical protein
MTSNSTVHVRAAIRWDRAGGPPPFVRHRPAQGVPGELLVVTDGARLRRIVLVLEDAIEAGARVCLATPATEMVSDRDLIVGPGEAGFPFSLAIQPDIAGWIGSSIVECSVGRLGRRWFDAVSRSVETDGQSLQRVRHGRPLGPAADPRHRFRRSELEVLRQLGGRSQPGARVVRGTGLT